MLSHGDAANLALRHQAEIALQAGENRRVRTPVRTKGEGPSGEGPLPKEAYPQDFVLELDLPWASLRERLRRLEGALIKVEIR